MAYQPGKTVAKIATPIGVIVLISNALQYVSGNTFSKPIFTPVGICFGG